MTPGRAIRFAPAWDCADAVVAFDANSGDYWLLTRLAVEVLRLVQLHNGIARSTLASNLPQQNSDYDIDRALSPTLQSLVEHRLLEPASWYTPAPTPPIDWDD